MLELFFKKTNIPFHLLFGIVHRVFMDLVVNERGVEEKERYVQGACLDLVPFDDRPADIIAAYEKVRFGEPAERSFARHGRTDISQSVGAEVTGISLLLSRLTKGNGHPGRAAHSPV